MHRLSNQTLAIRTLETRRCGYTLGLFIRRQLAHYAVLCVGFAIMFALFGAMAVSLPEVGFVPLGWAIGFACGVFLRDIRWFRAIRASWPFSERVMDWNAVQRLAEGDSRANPS